jgi:hypothetical protein
MYRDEHKPLIKMSSKTKPAIDSQLGFLIGEDIAKAIDADRRSYTTRPTESPLYSESDDFVDQSILFDEAGSETKQSSRIQIKKGPNGQEYEYEYVYYYDDDDAVNTADDADQKVAEKTTTTEKAHPVTTSIVHSSTTEKKEEKIEERLPSTTRFPPREPAVVSNDFESDEMVKKVNVKRPSLELVDSQSFNTEDKNFKGKLFSLFITFKFIRLLFEDR